LVKLVLNGPILVVVHILHDSSIFIYFLVYKIETVLKYLKME